MIKLLSESYARLWKSKVFWLCLCFMLAFSVYVMLSEGLFPSAGGVDSFDSLYMSYSQILGFCCAVFASLFLGTEYSDGTIRNKVVIGHTRARIYLANLTTVFVAALWMMAAWFVGGLIGIPLFGAWENVPGCIVNFVISLFTTAAFAAIFTLVAMLCTNKAVSAVISILLFLCLSAFAGSISSEVVRDLLPTGRVLWILGNDLGGSARMLFGAVMLPLLGSALITAAFTSAGILLFGKKDLI